MLPGRLALRAVSARYSESFWRISKGLPVFMFFSRFLLICSFGCFAASSLYAGDVVPKSAENKPAAPVDPPITFSWVHVDGPYIAMSFDDGPNAKLTPKLLDLLAAHHIKATFFVLGENVAENPEIVARAAREGHEIANHSWSHPNFGKTSDEGIRSQLRRTDDIIRNTIGTRPTLVRPPYGSISARQKKWVNQEFGYKIALWDVDPFDWRRPGPAVVCNRILKLTRAGSIILSHDIHPGTIEAMPSTFGQLEAKGFKFVTVSELISMATPEPPKPSPPAKSTSPTSTPRRE
jgi:peptidoglycan/xylan/chitin deacetylase (PgdA/CDA1 family)